MSLKAITVHWQPSTPNPAKVLVILEELGLPYKAVHTDVHTPESKKEYSKINPNGRLPAIEDPNTGMTLWESGAIITYLVDTYDKEGRISYAQDPEKHTTACWQHLQASGQGPYYGQAEWFIMFHPEQLESAQLRYLNEIKRVPGVLDARLASSRYLVGDKVTYADLSFVSWDAAIGYMFHRGPKNDWNIDDFPNFKRWHEALLARPSVQKVMAIQKAEDAQSAGSK